MQQGIKNNSLLQNTYQNLPSSVPGILLFVQFLLLILFNSILGRSRKIYKCCARTEQEIGPTMSRRSQMQNLQKDLSRSQSSQSAQQIYASKYTGNLLCIQLLTFNLNYLYFRPRNKQQPLVKLQEVQYTELKSANYAQLGKH